MEREKRQKTRAKESKKRKRPVERKKERAERGKKKDATAEVQEEGRQCLRRATTASERGGERNMRVGEPRQGCTATGWMLLLGFLSTKPKRGGRRDGRNAAVVAC